MKAPSSRTPNMTFAPFTRQKERAYPLMAPAMMDRITDGMRMRTEFQKPTLMPLHSRPVQADDQALIQASKVSVAGQATILPSRISSMGLREVTTMIQSGSRKNRAAVARKT